MIDLAKEIWQTMCTNKLRTILTGISVAWGIFMLVLLLAISNGLVKGSSAAMESNDPYRISVWGGMTNKAYNGLKEGRTIKLREGYIEDIESARIDNVASVSASNNLSGTISTNRDYLTSTSAKGVYPNAFTGKFSLVHGRFINQADLAQKRKVVVLRDQDAAILFDKPENAIGQFVKIGNFAFTVVGIYNNDRERNAYIPFTTAYALSGYNDQVSSLEVHLDNVSRQQESAAVEKEVVKTLAKSAVFHPEDKSAVWTFDRFGSYVEQQTATSILTIAMWVIGLLTLITGIVGVSNIMFVSVKERTHEIGIRRALGAKPHNLITQVMLESVALTATFGYCGIVLGTVATQIFVNMTKNYEMFASTSVDLRIAMQVMLALVIAGALAGLFPALKAIKVKPVEALRDE